MMRVEPGEKDWFKRAAEEDGITEVSSWLRQLGRKAARRLVGAMTRPAEAKKPTKKRSPKQ